MVIGRIIIAAAIVSLARVGTGYADVTWTSWAENGCSNVSHDPRSEDQQCANPPELFEFYNLNLSFVAPPPCHQTDLSVVSEVRPPQVLTPRSLDLYFCGLMGLGMYESLSWTRKRTFRAIPVWRHNGWHLQSRPCLAISVQLLWPKPVVYLVRPDGTAENSTKRSCHETVTPLWRELQFAPTAQSGRGPPRGVYATPLA